MVRPIETRSHSRVTSSISVENADASVAAIGVLCLWVYWNRLAVPHRLNAIALGAAAAFDIRVLAMFGMASTVLLSATMFRHGIDSDRLRPMVKRAEWYFFHLVFAAASWALVVALTR